MYVHDIIIHKYRGAFYTHNKSHHHYQRCALHCCVVDDDGAVGKLIMHIICTHLFYIMAARAPCEIIAFNLLTQERRAAVVVDRRHVRVSNAHTRNIIHIYYIRILLTEFTYKYK